MTRADNDLVSLSPIKMTVKSLEKLDNFSYDFQSFFTGVFFIDSRPVGLTHVFLKNSTLTYVRIWK